MVKMLFSRSNVEKIVCESDFDIMIIIEVEFEVLVINLIKDI